MIKGIPAPEKRPVRKSTASCSKENCATTATNKRMKPRILTLFILYFFINILESTSPIIPLEFYCVRSLIASKCTNGTK